MEKAFWLSIMRFFIVTIAIVCLFIGVYFTLPLIYPFIIGLLLALLFNPFVLWLERSAKFPRWLSVTLAILILFAILVSIVVLVVLEIASEISNLQGTLPEYIEDYINLIEDFIMGDLVSFYDQFTAFYSSLDDEVRRNLELQVQTISSSLVNLGNNVVTTVVNGVLMFISKIPTMAVSFIISLLAFFFISKDWPKLQHKFATILPESFQSRGGSVLKDLRKAFFGFIKAQLTLISITFCIVLIGLAILGIEYALTLALIIAFVDLLPYLGTGFIFVPWIIYLFFSKNFSLVIGLSILYGIVLIQRQMMEPKILGTNVGLDPLLTLIALFVGFKLFGLIGLIIGPVSMVLIGALHRAGVFRDLWAFIRGS